MAVGVPIVAQVVAAESIVAGAAVEAAAVVLVVPSPSPHPMNYLHCNHLCSVCTNLHVHCDHWYTCTVEICKFCVLLFFFWVTKFGNCANIFLPDVGYFLWWGNYNQITQYSLFRIRKARNRICIHSQSNPKTQSTDQKSELHKPKNQLQKTFKVLENTKTKTKTSLALDRL